MAVPVLMWHTQTAALSPFGGCLVALWPLETRPSEEAASTV